ncbi:MAG: Peptidyl-tRNA hydrolase [Planctomycetota bacterium]
MKLIVGLGNPGRQYEQTRHNVGFDIAARVVELLGRPNVKGRLGGDLAEAVYEGNRVAILCPGTFMNASGLSVRKAVDYYRIDALSDDLLVICDDMNLPLGRLRFRPGGSAGGQKGLADIVAKLGADQFSRLRFGIDRPPPQVEVVDYVLGRFPAQVRGLVHDATDRAAGAVLEWVVSGVAVCMNRFNAADGPGPQGGPG